MSCSSVCVDAAWTAASLLLLPFCCPFLLPPPSARRLTMMQASLLHHDEDKPVGEQERQEHTPMRAGSERKWSGRLADWTGRVAVQWHALRRGGRSRVHATTVDQWMSGESAMAAWAG